MLASEARALSNASKDRALTISTAKLITQVDKLISKSIKDAEESQSTRPPTCVRVPDCLDEEMERLRDHFESQGYEVTDNAGYDSGNFTYYYVGW